ncbi:MAG: hypothetical protein ACFFG0_35010, partial [Candidatus Thorarchaeota archaeon]
QNSSWWARQFVEGMKELARAYNRFWDSREIEDLDVAEQIYEELNATYDFSIDLLDYVKFGRAYLKK